MLVTVFLLIRFTNVLLLRKNVPSQWRILPCVMTLNFQEFLNVKLALTQTLHSEMYRQMEPCQALLPVAPPPVPTGQLQGHQPGNHRSSTFRSFNPGTSPGGGAVTGTSPCHPLQLIGVTLCSSCRGYLFFPSSCLCLCVCLPSRGHMLHSILFFVKEVWQQPCFSQQ